MSIVPLFRFSIQNTFTHKAIHLILHSLCIMYCTCIVLCGIISFILSNTMIVLSHVLWMSHYVFPCVLDVDTAVVFENDCRVLVKE